MNGLLLELFARLRQLARSDEGQDPVDYGFLVALIALAAIAGTKSVATAIATVFSNISTSIT